MFSFKINIYFMDHHRTV